VLAVSAILVIVLFAVLLIGYNFPQTAENKEVFVGVTYCGDSVAEGKLLIDKVKRYTNLFVLQSGFLQRNFSSVDELGDYAVSAGLYFLPYFGNYIEATFSVWLEAAKQRWGTHFLGVYYRDEPGGKMLDDNVEFKDPATGDSITKTRYGDIVVEKPGGVVIHYEINGLIHLSEPTNGTEIPLYATFYPNGTISGQLSDESSFKTYEELMSLRPFKDIDEAAERFVARDQSSVEYLKGNSTKVFTSDYGLYWWDYLSGYDVILAHIGWNHTLNQQIGLVRGAAKLQSRDWGIVITWKYDTPPYLDNGTEILSQMRTAYEAGAKYFVLFNYYEDGDNPYGTMQPEHFQALENFWNNVIKNPQIIQGSIQADSVLVLPKNYGWGMRRSEDIIWGIFKADNQTLRLWDLMQSVLENHDLKIDIVFEDTAFPLTEDYQHIYNWAQNVTER
jgi:hypothetical protein